MAKQTHSYDEAIAERVGRTAAMIYDHIEHWCKNDGEYHDGHNWIFCTVKKFQERFPDLNERTIRRCLHKLEEVGLIKSGNYNKIPYDRTKWYTALNVHMEADKMSTSKRTKCPHHVDKMSTSQPDKMSTSQPDKMSTPITTIPIIPNNTTQQYRGSSRFTPPTVEEVRAYCKERGNNIDAEHFVNYYESIGWMRGKNKIKDWKACVITWEKKDKEAKTASKTVRQEGNEFDQLLREEGYIS